MSDFSHVDETASWVYPTLTGPLANDMFLQEHYPSVSKIDIENGYITRYFMRQANHQQGDITEIDVRDYNRLKSNPLFKILSLQWKITGPLDDIIGPSYINSPVRIQTGVETANKMMVENLDVDLPGLKYKLMNYIQFWVNTNT